MYVEWNASTNAPRTRSEVRPVGITGLLFIAGHVPLAILMHYVSVVTALHAFITVGVGVWLAVSDRRLGRTAMVMAYIAGAEVLWRMTNNQLFWELAKYSIILISTAALLQQRGIRGVAAPALCFGLLVPSGLLTISQLSLSEARNQLSFNLSGPLALALCAGFFSSLKLEARELHRVFTAAIASVTGIATITLFMIVTNPDITFSHQSNFALSGGFGPNQVSAALGLGMLIAVLFLLEGSASLRVRAVMLALVVWFGTQSALTFSRGGVFCAVCASAVAMLCYARHPRALARPLAVAGAVAAIGYFVVWPRLDAFTGGNITMRFQETDTSLRTDLGQEDLEIFKDHPLLGVGPGMSKLEHLDDIISHTEFTRLLAEHGALGILAMLLMLVAAVRNIKGGASSRERAIAAGLMTWAVLFMTNSAMRLAAPAFLFGLAFCSFAPVARTAAQEAGELADRPVAPAHRWRLLSAS